MHSRIYFEDKTSRNRLVIKFVAAFQDTVSFSDYLADRIQESANV